MTEETPMGRSDLEAKLVARAWQDEVFKQQLIANPQEAFKQEFDNNVSFSEDTDIRVLEETGNTFYLVIPKKPNVEMEELSEEQLEVVAGGLCLPDIPEALKPDSVSVSGCVPGVSWDT